MSITRHPLYDDPRSLEPAPLDEGLVQRLEASFKSLGGQADLLAERFYERLFRRAPGVRPLFPEELREQRKKLVAALDFVVQHLRSPDEVLPRLRALGAAHVKYGAQPGHYPIVCGTSSSRWARSRERPGTRIPSATGETRCIWSPRR
jgi:hypothetical protein